MKGPSKYPVTRMFSHLVITVQRTAKLPSSFFKATPSAIPGSLLTLEQLRARYWPR